MTSDLSHFDLTATLRLSRELQRAAEEAPTMERAARAVCQLFYDSLAGPDGDRACALVRCYKTHPFGELPDELKRFARRVWGTMAFSPPDPAMKCLTLLATVGDETAWNDRRASRNHQAIPLPSSHVVERAPMIAQMIRELGLDIAQVISPVRSPVRDLAGRSYGVFHVEEAAGSPYIPAQRDFVERYAIRSVVGLGGTLPAGDLFAVILFSRVPITTDAADRFRSLALDVKSVLARHPDAAVFDDEPRLEPAASSPRAATDPPPPRAG